MSQSAAFRALHQSPRSPLVLPNAWDASSARIVELAGAKAVATTSAGIAWAHGYADGKGLTRQEMLAALASIVASVRVPVTADIEGGYGAGSLDDVTATVKAVLKLGVAGINLEDSPGQDGQPLLAVEHQSERIRAAARLAGTDLFINARCDVYLFGVGQPETRFAETVRRAKAYIAAGASGVFVPGVTDPETIAGLVSAIPTPLNVMVAPGSPPIAELAQLGVARVSAGSGLAQVALEATRRAAQEMLERGTYDWLRESFAFPEANGLFR
jgi:2-methylisocitrate lyase-like PEP mutase family enzyme